MSSASTKSQRQSVGLRSCATSDVWIALESSGYAEQIRGGKSGRTRCSVVSSLQHFVFFSRLNVGEDYHTC